MSHLKWSLSKYARCESNDWKVINYESGKELGLMLKGVHLMVVHGDVLVESLSVAQSNQTIQSLYKNGTLVIGFKCQDRTTKFRVLFRSTAEGEDCVSNLKRFFKINISEGTKLVKERNKEPYAEMLVKIMKRNEGSLPVSSSIPEEYPLESAVKLCILDPGFPQLVSKIEALINTELNISKEK